MLLSLGSLFICYITKVYIFYSVIKPGPARRVDPVAEPVRVY